MSYIVEDIQSKDVNTKFGPKPAFSIYANGERYSYGFKKPMFKIGDTIDFQYTENTYGKNVDLASVQLLAKGEGASTATPAPTTASPSKAPYSPPTRPFPIPALHGDRAIVRQNSLSNAVNLFREDKEIAKMAGEDRANIIIDIARMFEAYSCGDLDMEKALVMAKADA
jgi:hypothetical protein